MESRRFRPFLHVRRGLSLPDFLEQFGSIDALRHRLDFCPRVSDEVAEAALDRSCLVETAPGLHGALLSIGGSHLNAEEEPEQPGFPKNDP
jgi:hypothetical protein